MWNVLGQDGGSFIAMELIRLQRTLTNGKPSGAIRQHMGAADDLQERPRQSVGRGVPINHLLAVPCCGQSAQPSQQINEKRVV